MKMSFKKILSKPIFRALAFCLNSIIIALLVGITVNQTTDTNGVNWDKLYTLKSFWLLIAISILSFFYFFWIENEDSINRRIIQSSLNDEIIERYKKLINDGKYDDHLISSTVIKDLIK